MPTSWANCLEDKVQSMPTSWVSCLEDKVQSVPTSWVSCLEDKVQSMPTFWASRLEDKVGHPRAYLLVVGMLRFVSDINQPSLPTPFYSVLVSLSVFKTLSTVFNSINSPDNSSFSDSVLPV